MSGFALKLARDPAGGLQYTLAAMAQVNLTNHFLIAMPNMADPYFSRTLTFICEHNEQGALGVVVNRPIEMTLGALFDRLSLRLTSQILVNEPVYFGGPVQTDRGFVLHQPLGEWQSTLSVRDRMGLTTSKDILEAVGRGGGPRKLLVTLGYAGWAAGQLENEIKQNASPRCPRRQGTREQGGRGSVEGLRPHHTRFRFRRALDRRRGG